MHPLRLLLYGSLVLAAAVAWLLASALLKTGTPPSGAIFLGVGAFVVFLLPWTGVFLWALRRARDLDELTERSRKVLPITDRTYHGELDDLARAIEEMRMAQMRWRRAFETHRAAMDEIVAALGEGLLAVTPEGRVAFANRQLEEMFGVTGAMVGRSVLEVVRKQSVAEALETALHGETSTERVT